MTGSSCTTDGSGSPSRRKYATVSRVVRTGKSGKNPRTQGPTVRTTAAASSSSSDATGVFSRSCAPWATARSTKARWARSARTIPASGWKSAVQPLGHADRPTLARGVGVQELVGRTGGVECRARALGKIVDELQQAVQLQELDAGFTLELVPAGERLLRQLDELHLRVREPNDARASVTRAARVADLELLVEDDVMAVARKRVCGGRAHDPRADDSDLGSHLAILARR